MVSTQVPAVAAAATLTLSIFTKGDVLAALMCLALAHRAKQAARGRVDGGVLGVDEENMAMKWLLLPLKKRLLLPLKLTGIIVQLLSKRQGL